jgi:hypothetical protein
MFNINEMYKYIDDNWDLSKEDRKDFFNQLRSYKYVCLFGAGGMGVDLALYLTKIGVKIDFFCDNNENLYGKEICLGIKCIPLAELIKLKEESFVIISTEFYNKIFQELFSLGCCRML